MDCTPPGSSVHGISRQEYWSGLPFSSPGDLPNPEIKPVSPALAGGFFATETSGKRSKSGEGLIKNEWRVQDVRSIINEPVNLWRTEPTSKARICPSHQGALTPSRRAGPPSWAPSQVCGVSARQTRQTDETLGWCVLRATLRARSWGGPP